MMNSSRILALGLATLLVFAAAPHGAAADLAPIVYDGLLMVDVSGKPDDCAPVANALNGMIYGTYVVKGSITCLADFLYVEGSSDDCGAVANALNGMNYGTDVVTGIYCSSAGSYLTTTVEKDAEVLNYILYEYSKAAKATDIADLKTSTANDIADLKTSTATDIAELKTSTAKATEIADLKTSTATDIADLKNSTATDIADLKTSTANDIADLKNSTAKATEMMSTKIEGLEATINSLMNLVKGLQNQTGDVDLVVQQISDQQGCKAKAGNRRGSRAMLEFPVSDP